jgi:hypothetical protein
MNSENQNNRRNFIRKAAMGSIMALSIPEIISASLSSPEVKKVSPGKGNVILFQGDSITDAGRNREDDSFNSPAAKYISWQSAGIRIVSTSNQIYLVS